MGFGPVWKPGGLRGKLWDGSGLVGIWFLGEGRGMD